MKNNATATVVNERAKKLRERALFASQRVSVAMSSNEFRNPAVPGNVRNIGYSESKKCEFLG
eukprot:517351-Amorphochlora_amoeboformis.AAC.3